MSPTVLAAVLLAALLHAIWNAMIKFSGDRQVIMAVTAGTTCLLAIPFMFLLPVPARPSWPFLFMSALVHTAYMTMLVRAYSHGDFGQIYPLARGSAPLLTAILGFFLLGETLAVSEIVGVILIVGCIFGFAAERIAGIRQLTGSALLYSLLTGLCITAYSLIDGSGARLADNSHSYTAWMFFLHGALFPSLVVARRKQSFFPAVIKVWKPGVLVAVISALAYWLVIWAFSQERIAPVAVLRETSVGFAALLSVFFLKERLTTQRLVLVVGIVIGVVSIGLY